MSFYKAKDEIEATNTTMWRAISEMQQAHEELLDERDELYTALGESLNLQSHYARLLNAYDGGQRMVFHSVDEWLKRFRQRHGDMEG